MFKFGSKRRYPIPWDKAFLISLGIVSIVVLAFLVWHLITSRSQYNQLDEAEFDNLFWTPGCVIPDLPETNSKIEQFFFDVPPLVCNKGVKPLFESNLTSIYLLPRSLAAYNVTLKNLNCCYQYFKNIYSEAGQKIRFKYAKKCIKFVGSMKIDANEEMAKVTCTRHGGAKNLVIYQDYFHFVSTKTEDFIRTQEDQLNILILGIDAVSRVNLHRQMPKTVAYLKTLEAVEMLGYNKIADNTYPNLLVVFTGHNLKELEDGCWPTANSSFYNCEYIWNKFRARGFSTAYGEDVGENSFYFFKRGVKLNPFDHYYNPYVAEQAVKTNNSKTNIPCTGSRLSYQVILRYAMDYVVTMKKAQRNFFGFFWTSTISHNLLNMPRLGDDAFVKWLKALKASGVLNHTALIFMSDHGIRQGAFRNTQQGYLEDSLPVLFITLPKWYRDQHVGAYRNLKTNAKRLVTPYDLHETLIDIGNFEKSRNFFVGNSPRGISLLSPITNNRTCKDAAIESHWCACKPKHYLELNAAHMMDAAKYTVDGHINRLLADYPECVQLKLFNLRQGRSIPSTEEVEGRGKVPFVDIRVKFKTWPGLGLFEATVRKTSNGKGNMFGVIGTVSRLDLYGNQSRCVEDPYLKLFCYCKGN